MRLSAKPLYTAAMTELTPVDQVAIARTRDGVARVASHAFAGGSVGAVSCRVATRELFVFCAHHFPHTPFAVVTTLLDLHGNLVPFTPGYDQPRTDEMAAHAREFQRDPSREWFTSEGLRRSIESPPELSWTRTG